MLDLANFILKIKSEHNPIMDKALKIITQDDVLLLKAYLDETPELKIQIGLNVKDGFDHFAVTAAVIDNSLQILEYLVKDLKCCLNIPNAINAIHLAAEFDDVECLKILVENGADVNIEGPTGQIPTYYAMDKAKKYLLSSGAKNSKVVTIKFNDNNKKFNALKIAHH